MGEHNNNGGGVMDVTTTMTRDDVTQAMPDLLATAKIVDAIGARPTVKHLRMSSETLNVIRERFSSVDGDSDVSVAYTELPIQIRESIPYGVVEYHTKETGDLADMRSGLWKAMAIRV